jgi:hypothetical protein
MSIIYTSNYFLTTDMLLQLLYNGKIMSSIACSCIARDSPGTPVPDEISVMGKTKTLI